MSAIPTPYTRQASFTSFQTEAAPDVGANLEAEFTRVKLASDQTQSRLAEVQRDDGKLANLSVHLDSLSADVRALLMITGGEIRGAWAAGTSYNKGDVVKSPSDDTYIAALDHVAGADFDIDLDADYWLQVNVGGGGAGGGGNAANIVDLKRDFGAVGDGVTIDSEAVQLAFDYCIQNSAELYVPPGTYLLQSNDVGTGGFGVIMLNFTANGQSLRVRGAGKGISVFKEAAGATALGGKFCKMFYLYLPDATNVAINKVSFLDLTLDKNGASNGTPADPWAYQQAHIFQCIATAASGSTVDAFEFINVEIKDKVAAGINLAMKAEVGRVLIQGVTETGWSEQFGQRGDLELTCFSDSIKVLDTNVRFSQTEPESGYEASADHPRNYFYSNCKIGTLQLQEPASASWYANVYVENCHISDEFSTQGLMAHVTNSTVNLSREIYARQGKFSNCTILMNYDVATNVATQVYIYTGNANSNYRQEWLFDNCEFKLNTDDQGVLATGYQIGHSTAPKITARNMKIVRLLHCTFDPRVERVSSCYEMGDYYFSHCKIRCWGSTAFMVGGASLNVGFLALRGNDYSELPEAVNIVQINRNNELWGFEWDEDVTIEEYRMTTSGGGSFDPYTVRPRIIMIDGSHPTAWFDRRFNVGDRIHNTKAGATNPVREWACTASGTPGTWAPVSWITLKGATASRPTLHATDVGVTYLDTSLSATGELITWGGTAWVAPLVVTQTQNWNDLATATTQSTTVAVPGAALGDYVDVSLSASLQGTRMWGEVTAADTVTVYHRNDTGANVNVASGSLRVKVTKK